MRRLRLATQLASLGLALVAATAAAQNSRSFGYLRTLEGGGSLLTAAGERSEAEENLPIAVGDRLTLTGRSRADLVLPDRIVLRVDGGSDLAFVDLAEAPDSAGEQTLLEMPEGNLLLGVPQRALDSGTQPRIDTPNATIYVQREGIYRITTLDGDWTQITVRSGALEVVSRRGSATLRADEELVVEGTDRPRHDLRVADAEDDLERWGRTLDRRLADVDTRWVDPDLAYATAPLRTHGSWIDADGRRAWRPSVAGDWSPYRRGRWIYTTSGICWVSYEPWGWLTYHYGTWDHVPSWGWVWYPDRHFSPAWVYWYWGADWVGWVPIGVYTRYYGNYYGWNVGFRYGYHGWVRGWGGFDDWWCFSRGRDLGRRDLRDRIEVGLSVRGGRADGLVLTDTRGFTRDSWDQPETRLRRLREKPEVAGLPAIDDFVARKPLPRDVEGVVIRRDGDVGRGQPGQPVRVGLPEVPKPMPTPGERENRPRDGRVGIDLRERSVPPGGSGDDWRGAPTPQPRGSERPVIRETPGRTTQPTPRDGEPPRGSSEPPRGSDDSWRREPSRPPRVEGTPSRPPGNSGTVGDGRRERITQPAPSSPPPAQRTVPGPDAREDWRSNRNERAIPPEEGGRGGRATNPTDDDWRRAGSRYPTIYLGPEGAGGDRDRRDAEPPVVRRVIEGVRGSGRESGDRQPWPAPDEGSGAWRTEPAPVGDNNRRSAPSIGTPSYRQPSVPAPSYRQPSVPPPSTSSRPPSTPRSSETARPSPPPRSSGSVSGGSGSGSSGSSRTIGSAGSGGSPSRGNSGSSPSGSGSSGRGPSSESVRSHGTDGNGRG